MDHRERDLDVWEEDVEKASDIEVKANLQSPFYVREIYSKYSKSHCLSVKKDKEDIYQKPRNETSKDKDKAKSQTSSSANQPQTQALKKDECSCWGNHSASKVNTIKRTKKDKDKALKDLSHVKFYIYHQNGYYANKYPKKAKN